jgi:hypothetical protein
MANQIILNEPLQLAAANITFTAVEWSAMVAQINSDVYTALWTGLIIGAVAGAAGLYLGLWYNGKSRK